MKDHPLFNDDPNDTERRSRNIDFININQWVNGKRQALNLQYEADALLTVSDVFAVTGEGQFELVGRENDKKRVVDRVALTLRLPPGAQPTPNATQQQAQQAAQQPVAPPLPSVPTMNLGTMQIPSGMDPNMAMILAMFHTSAQQNAGQLAAQREDARTYMQAQTQLMIGMANSNATLITGLLQGIGQMVRPTGAGAEGTAEAFIKGIETMTELHAGLKEGQDTGKPTDWTTVSGNIVNGIKTLKEVAAITNTPGAPVVPPGVP
jgi:hypothetical protein